MMTALLGLACAAMMALMCLPMAIGMLRRRWAHRSGATGPAPLAAPPAGERPPGIGPDGGAR